MAIANLLTNRRGLGWIPDGDDSRDYDFYQMGLGDPFDELPESLSLRNSIGEVFNQRSTNSCVAQAIANALCVRESLCRLPSKIPSRLFIYYNARRYHSGHRIDHGTSIRLACKGLKHYGVPDERFWGFSVNPLRINRRPGWEAYGMGFGRRLGEYYRILDYGDGRVQAIRTAISNGYPVVFGTAIARTFADDEGSTVINRPEEGADIMGNHAMLIVGYARTNSGGNLFEVLNSWGEGWRDRGFCFLTEDYIRWGKSHDFTVMRGWPRLLQGSI